MEVFDTLHACGKAAAQSVLGIIKQNTLLSTLFSELVPF